MAVDLGAMLSATAPAGLRGIEEITQDILRNKERAGAAILEIGRGLIEAKGVLSHGEWGNWLAEKVEFSERSAQNFMRLAREWSNPQALADLGAAKALTLLALTPVERDEFITEGHVVNGEEKTVADMTSRELEQAVRERKEALEAKEAAETQRKAAEEKVETATRRAEELGDTVADLKKELEELRKQPIEITGSAVPDAAALDAARKEGADEASKTARKEAEEKLKAKIDKAEKAKADAEAQVQTIKAEQEVTLAKAGELEKQLKLMGNPAATEYKVHFDAVQKSLLSLNDCLDRLKTSDPELCAKLTAALIALGKKTYEDAKVRLNGEGERA